ncbi:MAG: DUF2937 family protein [Bauldia sp.]
MIARTLALIVALGLGFVLSQGPEFAQQYRQRLGGAVDELRRIILQFDEDSLHSGYDRAGAIALMASNSEQLVRDQSGRIVVTVARYGRLREQQAAFESDGAFVRLASFIQNFDPPLVERTFAAYEPAVPVTVEGLLLAGGGFFAGYFFVLGMAWPLRRGRRSLQPRNSVSR